MRKIKLTVLEKLINQHATSKELDFILYIARFQNEHGEVRGVYYRDFESFMSVQSFYDVKYSLQEKGIISVIKNSDIDYDITILDNDFSNSDFTVGYINVGHAIFKNRKFTLLKANEKLLVMDLMKITYSNRGIFKIGTVKFFLKYQDLFKVTKRVVRNYLTNIKEFFSFKLSNFIYIIKPRQNIYKGIGQASEQQEYTEALVRMMCRRVRIKEYEAKALKDTAILIQQYRGAFLAKCRDVIIEINAALIESIDKELYETKRILAPSLVHKILKKRLETY